MTSILVFIILTIMSTSVSAANESTSGEKRLLTAELTWKMKRIGSPVISPDGKWIVAPVTSYNIEEDKSHTDLWLFSPDGSVERQLTITGFADGQPVFSPDGSKLAFVSRRNDDDASQVYLLPMNEPGEAIRLTDMPTGVSSPKWAGDYIYFISNVWPEMNRDEMKEKIKKNKESKMSARTWNALPYSHWDQWLDEERQAHLFRIPSGGGETANITMPTGWELPRSSQGSSSYDVSSDGQFVAFNADSKRDGVDPNLDIFLVKAGGSEAINITEGNEATDASPLFSPDNRYLAYTRQEIKGFYADTRRLVIHDLKTGVQRVITGDWDRSADGLVWLPDASGLYGAIDDAGTSRIYHIDINKPGLLEVTGETSFSGLSLSNNGTLVAVKQSFLYPPGIVVVNTSNGD
jgi:dipeptidyl aminopeptidase/acylaminoacyl peptidase